MDLPEPDDVAIATMVAAYRAASGYDGHVEPTGFGDSAQMMEDLGRVVLEGPKRATAGWAEDPEADDEPIVPGDHEIVLGGRGQPLCILRFTEVQVRPYREVDPAFAWDEGEGDRTLAYWRDAHDRFFQRRAEASSAAFDADSPVELMRFEVVWPELDTPGPVVSDGDITVRPVGPGDRAWVRRVTGDEVSDDGWHTDQLPALLARRQLQTAGVLVFHPHPNGQGATEVVATALLDDDPEVSHALTQALRELARTHRWGHPSA